jgi:predicted N-acetyltransferase YhbS
VSARVRDRVTARVHSVADEAIRRSDDAAAVWDEVEGAWNDVFGSRRTRGWFARKRSRECIEDSLSMVAIDEERVVGFVLCGAPPSLMPWFRTAGVGVIATHRERGTGRAMLDALTERAGNRGANGLRSDVDDRVLPFYERLGYTRHRPRAHLRRGPRPGAARASEPVVARPPRSRLRPEIGWFLEAWAGTPVEERFVVHARHAQLGASHEPGGTLIHWVRADADPAAAIDDAALGPQPATLFGADPDWAGPPDWRPVQRYWEMRRIAG